MAACVHRLAGVFAVPAALLTLSSLHPARAQTPPAPAKPEMTENCPGLVASAAPRLIPAAFRELAALNPDQVRITYNGHSTFTIESPQQVRIATDYNDYVHVPGLPDIVTMNHAHDTHYTDHPDPAIKHVLRGWGASESQPARYDLTVKDVRVRNVPTNIRNWSGGTERYGNSIFIFEIANLCIAHLGHLHHTLTDAHLGELGQIDVLLVPVDGAFTMSQVDMVEVIREIAPPLVIPMHFFNETTLARFLDRMRATHLVKVSETPTALLSRAALPSGRPEVLVLPGS